jgi:hypothetical protein
MSAEDACNGLEPPEVDIDTKYVRAQAYLRHKGLFIMKRKPQTLFKIKNTPKRYKRARRMALRYAVWVEKLHKRPYLHVIRGILHSDSVRVQVKKLTAMITQKDTRIGYEGYVTIQNVQALPRMKRLPFRIKYHIGKILRQW